MIPCVLFVARLEVLIAGSHQANNYAQIMSRGP